jgi:anti-sigma B factor antagonist
MDSALKDHGGWTVVEFRGEIDLEYSPAVRKVLLEAVGRGRDMVVDLSNVTLIDSSGVASFLEAAQAARHKGVSFALAAVTDPVMRVLKLARLDTVFTIAPTVAAATGGGKAD